MSLQTPGGVEPGGQQAEQGPAWSSPTCSSPSAVPICGLFTCVASLGLAAYDRWEKQAEQKVFCPFLSRVHRQTSGLHQLPQTYLSKLTVQNLSQEKGAASSQMCTPVMTALGC